MRAAPNLLSLIHLFGFALSAGASGGCGNPALIVEMSPLERIDLQQRARELLLRAAQSERDEVRSDALQALVKIAPQEGLSRLRSALRVESALVRFVACVGLGELRDKVSLSELRALIEDPDPRVRLGAAFAAYRCGEQSHAAMLTNVLHDNPDESLRAMAAQLIGQLGEPRAARHLRRAYQSQESNNVLAHIAGAQVQLGDEDAADRLIQMVQWGTETRLAALLILAEVELPAARNALLYRLGPAETYLEARLIAARALGRIGSPEGFDLALRVATRPPEKSTDDRQKGFRLRSLAAHALGEIGDPRALHALKALAKPDNDPRLQVAACFAICRILNP